jgi:hypothetical protein
MKNSYLLLLSIIVAGIISCSRNNEVTFSDSVLLTNDLVGKWQVTQFIDSGIDKTDELSSVNLQLNSTGELLLFYNDSTISGTWLIVPDIGLDQVKLSLSVMKLPYSNLQASWYVYDKTASSLSLSNNSPSRSRLIQLQRI